MRFRPVAVIALAGALLALPAASAEAAPAALVKVRSCQVGDSSKARQATFYARMHSVPGSARMMMRFTLVDHRSAGTATVAAPALQRWRRSRRGVRSFGYAQTVTGLETGGAYATSVEYRWVDARGRTVKILHRSSSDCRQDGALANLTLTRVAARPGDAAGIELYSVDVTNDGAAAAHDVVVDLFVDDAASDAATKDVIAPGETVTLRVSGPACSSRLKAVVDRLDRIHETTEDDNVLRSRCPAIEQ